MADTIVDAPPGYTKGGIKIGSIVDAPPGYKPEGTPASAPSGGLDLGALAKRAGGALEQTGRNLGAAYTAGARDPVGALNNALGATFGGVAGGVMGPVLSHDIRTFPKDVVRGATNPEARARYEGSFNNMLWNGIRPQGEGMPARIGRGVEDFTGATVFDPLTHGGGAAMGAAAKGVGALGGAAMRTIKPLGKYVDELREAVNDPRVAPAAGVISNIVGKAMVPLRFGVNTGKELMFLNPLPHGLGNQFTLNMMRNGLPTALKGLYYGVKGAPKATVSELERIGAPAWTPELMAGDRSEGLISKLGKLPVPAAVRAGVGSAAGGAIANKTSPDTDTPEQRFWRTGEGALIGAITGAAPEALNASNKIMSRLETGQRAAALEKMPKPVLPVKPKPHITAAEVAAQRDRALNPKQAGRASGRGSPNLFQHGMKPEAPPDPRADELNETFGGGKKGPVERIVSAAGGPFPGWQLVVVPKNVGSALVKNPARVEAVARGQDITNRDVLRDKPYKLQVGGPIGGFSEMVFDTPKYGSRILGPLGGIDPNEATNPKTFSPADKAKAALYNAIPGRQVVGPFFGDTMFPSNAPTLPNAAVSTALGWHFSNKTPKKDAILEIMRTTGLDSTRAGWVYERVKPKAP